MKQFHALVANVYDAIGIMRKMFMIIWLFMDLCVILRNGSPMFNVDLGSTSTSFGEDHQDQQQSHGTDDVTRL